MGVAVAEGQGWEASEVVAAKEVTAAVEEGVEGREVARADHSRDMCSCSSLMDTTSQTPANERMCSETS